MANIVNTYIVIPARLQSTRLPRKMLLRETGKPLVQHTYEAASKAQKASGVCVATDHPEIEAAVRQFGGQACMTSPAAASGTDRVAEVAAAMPDVDVFVNVQGDEPEIDPVVIDRTIELLESDPTADMSTMATPIRKRSLLLDPNCVKVVRNHAGHALYFSRSPIPYARDWSDDLLTQPQPFFLQHVGIYAYRRAFLLELTSWPAAMLEDVERLEQLRVLAAGRSIAVGICDEGPLGIDTPDDYRAFVSRARQR